MKAAHPEAEKASLILALLFTWAFPGALKKSKAIQYCLNLINRTGYQQQAEVLYSSLTL